MKVQPRRVDRFVSEPDPGVRAVLVFGPDAGLVRERATALARSVVPSLDDPFRVAELSGDALAEDPARLGDEAAAMALTGGRRVVLVRDAGERGAKAFEAFLTDPVGDALVVASAGDLSARSKLRKLFEASESVAAAIPCYLDDAETVSRLIEQRMRADDITLSQDAKRYLVEHLGADRGLSRAEIDKLALYAGPGGSLDLESVSAAVGDSAANALDDVIYAAADGDARGVDRALEQSFSLGVSAVPILRQTAAHFVKLRQVRAAVDRGQDAKTAVKSLKPPIFWKVQDRFAYQVRRLDPATLANALDQLLDAEARCKRSGAAEALIASRTLHGVAALTRRAGRR